MKTSDDWAQQHPALKLLILFGSRARGDHDLNSDWDIAFLSDPDPKKISPWIPETDLLLTLSEHGQIPGGRIDLIDLSTCSDILTHFIAHDGQLIYKREPGEFERFRQQYLKAPAELKQYRQTQRAKVIQALERWGA
ncbi:MAG: nucleotidyltransferase domain-containing protein [Leptolyngbyaceae cyanobacterium SL_1_1]|nr:nucleotidyltransferase domain-containing protein [Leptolyngbyaceae cyanobacterium RM1_1_2]NJO10832.1 nucleotidyltransferase domain-containing protein [Leptolyngbyaceae cyanobacterium SL_1_1]